MMMTMMMPNRRQNKNVFVLLAIGFALLVAHPYLRPTRESFYEKCVRERLGSSSSSSSSKISASSLGKTLWRAIRPEGELCSKTMIYDDYVLFSTMVVNENVYVGALSFVWVPVPWPASLVLAKTVLAFARANRNVLKAYAGVGVGFVLMKVLKKFVMVVKLVFALIALKATNDAFERHHGTSPLDGVLKGLNEARKRVARAIAPNDGSSKKGRPAGNNKKKNFTGKGKKLGRK